MDVEPLPQREPADVFTERLPVQHAVDPAAAAAQHALGPAPLFDPDRVAPVDPPAQHSGAAIELQGDELADELAEQCPGRAWNPPPARGWFDPAVPGALLESGSQVPTADALRAAADLLAANRHHAAAAWVDTWAVVSR